MKWVCAVSSTYTFPIGASSTYYPFTICPTVSSSSPTIQAQAFSGSCGGSGSSGFGSLSTTEYWLASLNAGNSTTATVGLTRQTALGGLTAIGICTTGAGGTYANLHGTVSGTSILNSVATGNFTTGGSCYFVMGNNSSLVIGSNSG